MKIQTHVIRKNSDRYGDFEPKMPDEIVVIGSKEQAEYLASRLTDYWPGQDYAYYVAWDDDRDGEPGGISNGKR